MSSARPAPRPPASGGARKAGLPDSRRRKAPSARREPIELSLACWSSSNARTARKRRKWQSPFLIAGCGVRIADCRRRKIEGEKGRRGEGEKGRRGEGGEGRRGEGEKERGKEEEPLRASEGSQRLCGENDLDLTSATFPINASNAPNPQSAVRNPQSRDPQSAIRNPQSIKVRSVSENLTRE